MDKLLILTGDMLHLAAIAFGSLIATVLAIRTVRAILNIIRRVLGFLPLKFAEVEGDA